MQNSEVYAQPTHFVNLGQQINAAVGHFFVADRIQKASPVRNNLAEVFQKM